MANKYKGTSYDTLKSYLDSIDVDTSNMDNDTLDSQYLQRLRKRNGEALSTREQREGNITLTQYLADADAERRKNENIAIAENNARQETAYNDYVNSKLAKYLNIAEENNGTAGYTGITEGNRIALANQEKNIASNIQNTKQNAISDYLKQYDNTLASNSRDALDQTTTFWGEMDKKEADEKTQRLLQESNDKLEKQTEINNYKGIIEDILAKNGQMDGTDIYYNKGLDEARKYINGLDLTNEEKRKLLEEYKYRYSFESYANGKEPTLYEWEDGYDPNYTPQPPQPPTIPKTIEELKKIKANDNAYARFLTNGKDVVFTSKNGKDISEETLGTLFNYSMDGNEYTIRGGAVYDSADKVLSTEALYKDISENKDKMQEAIASLNNGEALCWYTGSKNPPNRYIIYKAGNKYHLFAKTPTTNSKEDTKKGFLKLYQTLESKGLVLNDLVKG